MLLLSRLTMVLIALGGSAFLFAPANAKDKVAGPVPAQVLDVYDGDTVTVRARIWLGQVVETRVRIEGIDTPELRSKCEAEKVLARAARDYLATQVADKTVHLKNVHYGKFAGRVLADLEIEGLGSAAELMIAQGHARPYDGGKRSSWCP